MTRPARKMVNLSIEETSGVDHPAHLHEGWLVMKAASIEEVDKAARPMKTEDGIEFPSEAFAYVPDPDSPSTWKLRLWESPAKKVTARQVGMAVAALGAGFRGQKVQIPSGDLADVKAKVRSAWSDANPDREDEMPSVLKATEEVPMETQDMDLEKAEKPSYEDLEKMLAEANDRIKKMETEKGSMKKEDDEEEEDMMKSAPESVRKAYEAVQKAAEEAQAKAEAAEAELRKERAERADVEAVAKARSAYANLGLDPEQVGPALRRLSETDSDLAKSVEDVLAAADAKVESADIFTEIGKSVRPSGTAYEKAEAMAKAAVADGKSATFEQALTDVFASNGDLYVSYLNEQGK